MITPSSTSPESEYRLQERFQFNDDEDIGDLDQIRALQDALALARRLLFTPFSIDLLSKALGVPGRPNPSDDKLPLSLNARNLPTVGSTKAHVEDYQRHARPVIVVSDRIAAYTCVKSDKPLRIYIRLDVITSLGEAYRRRKLNPNGIARINLFTAVILAHSHIDSIRMWQAESCQQIPLYVFNETLHDNKNEHSYGNGQWWWDHQYIGGEILALIYPENHFLASYPNKIESLVVQVHGPPQVRWCELLMEDCMAVVSGAPGWQWHLPFRPHPDQKITFGMNDANRIGQPHQAIYEDRKLHGKRCGHSHT